NSSAECSATISSSAGSATGNGSSVGSASAGSKTGSVAVTSADPAAIRFSSSTASWKISSGCSGVLVSATNVGSSTDSLTGFGSPAAGSSKSALPGSSTSTDCSEVGAISDSMRGVTGGALTGS